jgi:hypothetical protein
MRLLQQTRMLQVSRQQRLEEAVRVVGFQRAKPFGRRRHPKRILFEEPFMSHFQAVPDTAITAGHGMSLLPPAASEMDRFATNQY